MSNCFCFIQNMNNISGYGPPYTFNTKVTQPLLSDISPWLVKFPITAHEYMQKRRNYYWQFCKIERVALSVMANIWSREGGPLSFIHLPPSFPSPPFLNPFPSLVICLHASFYANLNLKRTCSYLILEEIYDDGISNQPDDNNQWG